MARSWLIGSDPACDLVVNHQAVSGRHCRLTVDDDSATTYLLEDNGSTNGTFVDGRRLTAPCRVSRDNLVTLGQVQPMPWPAVQDSLAGGAPTRKVLRIGRESDNDLVVSLPTVSGYHARVVWSGRLGEAEIEDLGSSNGTAIGAPDRRVERAVVTANDTIYLGTHALPAVRVFEALGALPAEFGVGAEPVVIGSVPVSQPQPAGLILPGLDLGRGPVSTAAPVVESFGSVIAEEWREASGPAWKPLIFVALGAVAGGLAVASAGFDSKSLSNPAEWAGAAQALAALLSRLGLAAVGLGLVIGVAVGAGARPAADLRRWLVRALVAAVVCLAASLLEWGTFRALVGADTGSPAALGLLWLGAGVGLMLGLAVAAAAPRPVLAWGAVALLVIPLWGLGGESVSWVRLPGWAKAAAGFNPSRWTFEGLLLMASERLPVLDRVDGPDDLAEPYFPAETARMGSLAATLALGAMLLGWGAVAAFIAAEARPQRLPRSQPVGRPAT